MVKIRSSASRSRGKVTTILYFTYIIGGIFVASLLLYLYLTFYPFKTIEVYNSPVPILNSAPIRTGEAVFYETHFCKLTDAPGASAKTLEGADPKNNKLVVPSTAQVGTAPKSIYGDVKFRLNDKGEKIFDFPCDKDNPQIRQSGGFVVPSNVPAGTYRLRIVSRYRVNAIREIPYQFLTQEFIIEDGQTRNPAPRPSGLSIVAPKEIQVQSPDHNTEAILEPVAPLPVNVPALNAILPPEDSIPAPVTELTKPLCLPVVGCVKI